jgi:proline dehydrogenase
MFRNLVLWLSTKKRVTDAIARQGMRRGFARRFVAGESLQEALSLAADLCRDGRRVILNHLGENVTTPHEARLSRDSYLTSLENLDHAGLEGNVSIKLTQLGLDLDRELCLSLAHEIAARAKSTGRTFEIDMEASAYTERTIQIFEAMQRSHGNAGIALQAYLRRSSDDLERLIPLGPRIRLVKGAYREPERIAFQKKSDIDANYRRLLDRAFEHAGAERASIAVATHDPAMIAHATGKVGEHGVAKDRYEFQMLLGIRRDLQNKVFEEGHPLRIYLPWGTAWCPYFMRRLAERPANSLFVLRSLLAEKPAARPVAR